MFAPLLPSFILTALLIELTPGPNMAWLALLSAERGRRAGFAALAGIALGLSIISAGAAFGLAEIITPGSLLFHLLRYGGVAFLLWLAWEAWRGPHDISPERIAEDGKMARHFRRGLIINLLNPKAALFFVAILPGFIVPERPLAWQLSQLSLAYVCVASFIHFAIVLLASASHKLLQAPERMEKMRKIFAALLFLVAMWFLFQTG
jgi:threonine/homoserine/homoserine lactone efflux protein